MVLELASGGELFNYIITRGPLPEPETGSIFGQIFSALAFIVWSPFTRFSPLIF